MPAIKRPTVEEYLAEFGQDTDQMAQQELAAAELRRTAAAGRFIQSSQPAMTITRPAELQPVAVATPVAVNQPVAVIATVQQPAVTQQPVVIRQPAAPVQPVAVPQPAAIQPVVRVLPAPVAVVPAAPQPTAIWATADCPPLACPPTPVCPPARSCPPQPCAPTAPTYCAPCNTQVLVGPQQQPAPSDCPQPDQPGHGAAILGACLGGLIILVLILVFHLVQLVRR